MKRLSLLSLLSLLCRGAGVVSLCVAGFVAAGPVDSAPANASGMARTSPADESTTTTVAETVPEILGPDIGAATPAPVLAPSAALLQIPAGCPSPPVASIVFVGQLVAKDRSTARYSVDQIRAGAAPTYIVTGLIDIRYPDETQYLTVGDEYLVGAAPAGTTQAMHSKVRETDLLFGGNAVIGLTEKSSECPVAEDPIRTLHVDGRDVETSLFTGLKDSKIDIALAFAKPMAVALAVILVLALIRWLFTAIFVSVRRAADGTPVTAVGPDRRHHLPDL